VTFMLLLFLFILGCTPGVIDFAKDQDLIVTRETENAEKKAAEIKEAAGDLIKTVKETKEELSIKTFSIRAYQFEFEPDMIEVDRGDMVVITITSMGFLLVSLRVFKENQSSSTVKSLESLTLNRPSLAPQSNHPCA